MTAASTSGRSETASRPKRTRVTGRPGTLTTAQLDVLALLAENRFLSTVHVELIMGYSGKTAREHLLALYATDPRLVERITPSGNQVGSSGLVGHNVHYPTAAGLRALDCLGLRPTVAKRPAEITPSGYLHHELNIRDVLAWISVSARNLGHCLEKWDCSDRIDVGGCYADAAFAYRIADSGPGQVLAGFVEADRGTQRGTSGRTDRWASKITAYSVLFSPDGKERRKALTGYAYGVLLVTVPDANRAQWVAKRVQGTPMAPYTRIAVRDELVPPLPKREAGQPQGKRPPLPDAHDAAWLLADGRRVPLVERKG